MENETDSKLIFRERIEIISLLTAIRNQTKDEPVRLIIKKYFNSKYGLFAGTKKEIPYHYSVISPELHTKLSLIPEDIINHEDAIEFLLRFYYKNADMSKAQIILTQEDAAQIIMKDYNNANEARKKKWATYWRILKIYSAFRGD